MSDQQHGQLLLLNACSCGWQNIHAAAYHPAQMTLQCTAQRDESCIYTSSCCPVHGLVVTFPGITLAHQLPPFASRAAGFNGVFVPLLVDDLHRFLAAFEGHDFWGFSVTIPHKEAAFQAASSSAGCDPVAAQIGAVNTLIRQPPAAGSSDGSSDAAVAGTNGRPMWRGYNTDWLAAISAIERVLAAGSSDAAAVTSSSGSSSGGSAGASPLQGKAVCVVGAGGAGRALAFGAASKGAKVLIANRNRQRAEALAAALPEGQASVVDWADLQAGAVSADVLANSTSVGMVPNVEDTPVATEAVKNVSVVQGGDLGGLTGVCLLAGLLWQRGGRMITVQAKAL